jgi:hypothetical protein
MWDVLFAVVLVKFLADMQLLGILIGMGMGAWITTQYPETRVLACNAARSGTEWLHEAMRRLQEASKSLSSSDKIGQ